MLKIENLYLKNALFTIGFYILLLIASYFLDVVSPSGPCTPGLGAALLLVLPFISGLMLIINIFRYFIYKKELITSIIIHFLIFVSLLIFIKTL
ncbi:hypothetical protein OX283_008770 [Flavobacterium sp. SUN052]|uniref:hypothetical protein n=1 Tax=Flavobacterium sp. SUN052 TaxID=3002441 RepID=UPI00237DCEC8|nr:hypothetical protein [Flavobacterium sp. SUN052]MEC4004748.1 hypothetical protein [Flavobacterium sp. SUN052]